jgi:hypothetical protein
LAGASSALDVLWTDATDWQVDVPVNVGRSDVTLEAFDFQGERIGSIVVPVTRQPGDFSGDGTVDGTDLDQLCQFLQAGDLQGDLNGDLQADFADLQVMVNQIMGTSLGDANLDGVFNSRDLVQVFQVGQYEDAVAGNSRWSDGDWNCDGDFTSRDIVLAFQNGGYVAGAQAAASSDGMATQLAIESEPHWRSVDIAFALLALDDAFDSDPRRSTNR